MCSYGVDGDMEIIRKACSILQNNFAFSYSTVQMQLSFFDGVSEEDYRKLDYKL